LAFSLPAAGTMGNLGRNVLLGPGLVILNLGLDRTFFVREKQSFQIRAEAFNIANHPNFQIPSGTSLFDSTGARLGGVGADYGHHYFLAANPVFRALLVLGCVSANPALAVPALMFAFARPRVVPGELWIPANAPEG
jgi:hypothetical protein